jgi:protein gp37
MSKIEWTDETWNPVTGCTKISPGCKHCYAERMALRLQAMGQPNYANGFQVTLQPHTLDLPMRWKKPRMVFVDSMSDLFHESVPDAYIEQIMDTMLLANWHTYQVLTKRSERMRYWHTRRMQDHDVQGNHIWWGVSVEDRKHGLPRIADLQATPVSMRFLSIEPLLEDLGEIPLRGINWVIVGGESGPGARRIPIGGWVRDIRDQCARANVPFFFKQWGGAVKSRTGRVLDGRTWDEMPGGQT